MVLAGIASTALAVLSLLVVRPAPSYDSWAWLLWGREVAAGGLSTLEGPAFKPLAVAVCAVVAPLGHAAPAVWVLLARVAALLAVALAYRLGRRLGGPMGGTLAAVGVALSGGFVGNASTGLSEGLLIAVVLAGAEAWRTGRTRVALACGAAAGLLRVETWPFLLAGAVVVWRRRPEDRPLLALAAVALPAGWLVPELIGSGQVLRSAARARVPDAGQPALADVPLLASVADAVRLPLWPLWGGIAALAWRMWRGDAPSRAALIPAGVGLAWMAIVAAMAQAGFSGEPRYALPGAALIGIAGGVGLATAVREHPGARRPAVLAVVALLAVAAAPRAGDAARVRRSQQYQWALQADLADSIEAAGGPSTLLACGRPYVGPRRGPLLAYRLGVPRHEVEPDGPVREPAVVFRSRLTATAPPTPRVPSGFSLVGQVGRWEVAARCRPRTGLPRIPPGGMMTTYPLGVSRT